MDADWQLRLAAFDHLNRLRDRSGGLVRAEDMQAGFEFGGEPVPLFNQPVGIWRPRQLGKDGAALSVTTAPPKAGKVPPYDDDIARDDDWLVYRYQREGPENWMNRAVVTAMELGRPLIYFCGVTTATYEALYPMYVVRSDPTEAAFHLSYDAMAAHALDPDDDDPPPTIRRGYAIREVKERLHQHRFRTLVMRAYQTRCAVCRLRHDPLLDAAHILPDKDERGRPEVPNGLALCKIHHAAFDAHILGVTPKCVIKIRHDILEEQDGPMLLHGLQNVDGQRLNEPRKESLKPNPEYLAARYERFRAA